MTLDDLFQEVAGPALQRATTEMTGNAAIAQKYKVDLIAYEGGQHLWEVNNVQKNAAITKLFDAANRDPRMKQIYLQWLDNWKNAGGKLLVHFTDCSAYNSSWGRFGMVETLDQPRNTAPKYDALLQYIETHDAWW